MSISEILFLVGAVSVFSGVGAVIAYAQRQTEWVERERRGAPRHSYSSKHGRARNLVPERRDRIA